MAIIISLYMLILAVGLFQDGCGSDHREADLGSARNSASDC